MRRLKRVSKSSPGRYRAPFRLTHRLLGRTSVLCSQIGGCAQRKQLQKCITVYEQLKSEGLRPSAYTCAMIAVARGRPPLALIAPSPGVDPSSGIQT